MQTIHCRAHVGSDGVLKIESPTELHDADCEVVLVVHPVDHAETHHWPSGLFERFCEEFTDSSPS